MFWSALVMTNVSILVQRPDLPVDVQHLRLEEGRAVTGYNSFGHGEGAIVREVA